MQQTTVTPVRSDSVQIARLPRPTMTQLFNSSSGHASTMPVEKRTFSGTPITTNKQVNGSNSQVGQKIKNFFRINSHGGPDKLEKESKRQSDGTASPRSDQPKSTFRQSRFLPHISRNRSQTVASEGNPLEEGMSPTAHANPYFQHQGPPALRHHNEGSVPPSPPDTPQIVAHNASKGDAANGDADKAISAGKEELARKLRRVASAPNAQGLFANGKSDERPSTAELGKAPLIQHANTSTLSMVETVVADDNLLPVPATNGLPPPGFAGAAAFRRTYSSNSIKVRNVEVGPGSFDKIKLIGKGDVGKVYLVREKKSSRLYAMKGIEDRLPSALDGANVSQC